MFYSLFSTLVLVIGVVFGIRGTPYDGDSMTAPQKARQGLLWIGVILSGAGILTILHSLKYL